MSTTRKLAALGVFALLALQFVWHALVFPTAAGNGWLAAVLFSLPVLPALVLFVMRASSAQFWAGVAALLYFCHGITESWADPQARPLALLELALSVWIIVAGSWDGMVARFGKPKPPTNV